MNRTRAGPVRRYIFAKLGNQFGNKEVLGWIMLALLDRHWRIAKCPRKRVNAIERGMMKLKDMPWRQRERPFRIMNMIANDRGRLVELANAVFSFTARKLVRIGDQVLLFGNAVALVSHAAYLLWSGFAPSAAEIC